MGKLSASPEPYSTSGPTDSSGKTIVLVPKGLRDATLGLSASELDVLRWRKAKDAPLSALRTVALGTLDDDVRGITVIRYRAPTIVVKAVAADGTPIRNFKPKAVYPDGIVTERTPGAQWVTGVEGDVFLVPQPDGRWHSEGLLPDQEFTLTLEAPGYQATSQDLKVAEGAMKELEVKLKPTMKASDPASKTSAAKPTTRYNGEGSDFEFHTRCRRHREEYRVHPVHEYTFLSAAKPTTETSSGSNSNSGATLSGNSVSFTGQSVETPPAKRATGGVPSTQYPVINSAKPATEALSGSNSDSGAPVSGESKKSPRAGGETADVSPGAILPADYLVLPGYERWPWGSA